MSPASQSILGISFLFGTIFGLLAAACAFIIAYQEYQHHFQGKREPLRMAAGTALIAFLFFFFASFLPVLLLPFLSK